MKKQNRNLEIICPCQSANKLPVLFSNCCQNFINGTDTPQTAEQLMRSRYTAFVLENEPYLLNSWHSTTKPNTVEFDNETKWLGLKIISTKMGQDADQKGWVKFIARYKINGKAHRLEEHSYFTRESSFWRYVSAENNESTQANDV